MSAHGNSSRARGSGSPHPNEAQVEAALSVFGLAAFPMVHAEKTLKSTYRMLAAQHHPDKVQAKDEKIAATEKMQRIHEARHVLLRELGRQEQRPQALKVKSGG